MPPIDENTDGCMRFMARNIKEMVGEGNGFILLVFPFGSDAERVAHYISNGDRETMIQTLREQADALELKLNIPNVGAVQ